MNIIEAIQALQAGECEAIESCDKRAITLNEGEPGTRLALQECIDAISKLQKDKEELIQMLITCNSILDDEYPITDCRHPHRIGLVDLLSKHKEQS